jgi:hypothetical protein
MQIDRQRQLYKDGKKNSKPSPRVVSPPKQPTRSSEMISQGVAISDEEVPMSYNDLTDKPIIPDQLSDLLDDSTHRTVTDIEKAYWNGKTDNEYAIVMAIVLGP